MVKKANREMMIYVYAAVIVLSFITFRSFAGVLCAVIPLMVTSVLCEALMVVLGGIALRAAVWWHDTAVQPDRNWYIEDLYFPTWCRLDGLFVGVRAPSTLGTFLRSFTHGHVQQLDAVGAGLLTGLTCRVPGMIAGAAADQGLAFLDVDDTIREVHGYSKQGAGYGYTRVRGLNIQLAALSTPLAAPVIVRARLRKGSTSSARGAGRMLAQAITTARASEALILVNWAVMSVSEGL